MREDKKVEALVGYSGFVGSNLTYSHQFNGLYDSKNVKEAYNTYPDLLIYSGVPAQKFIANKYPEEDFKIIENAIYNIQQIKPKMIILISTIDVYKKPNEVNEDSDIETYGLEPYGKNRYYLEKWVKENFEDYLIVHLPGLYGKNIKKNFIYDLINVIPNMILKEKFEEIVSKNNYIEDFYTEQENGFYKCKELQGNEKKKLKEYFQKIGFSALNFTDSRGIYQFYNLKYLWNHIEIALANNIKILNLAVEPIKVSELYYYLYEKEFKNELANNVAQYNFKTKYDKLFNGDNGYIYDKKFILQDIKAFVDGMK